MPRYTHEDLVEIRRDYTKKVRSAKRQAWKNFVENCDDVQKAAHLYRILKNKAATEVGLLKNPNGEILSPQDTLDNLCQTRVVCGKRWCVPRRFVLPHQNGTPR